MKPGIYEMPDEEYFAHPAISNSDLKQLRRSPAHFKEYKENPPQPTPAMLAGTILHNAILEPDTFRSNFCVLPEDAPPRPTKAQLNAQKKSESAMQRIMFWEQWEELNGQRTPISREDYDEYMRIADTIRNHEELKAFFFGGKPEHAIFGADPETKILCKCKPDYLNVVGNYNVLLELKSTDDARFTAFQRTAYNFGYFQGAAFYTDVMDWSGLGVPDLYIIVAFERKAPHGIKIYELPDLDIERGRRQYREALDLYAYCNEVDHWPAYDTTIETLTFPHWAKD